MILRNHNGVKWLEFELLAECPIIHGCFLRQGGESLGHLNSLNLSLAMGDVPETVLANRKKVSEALQLPQIVAAKLCHGPLTIALNSLNGDLPLSDGLSSKIPQLGMMVTQADCQAAIFYDPMNHVMANVHCGWRGNVQDIYGQTVKHMQEIYGSHPADLLVGISPSLGPLNSEFVNYQEELPETFLEFQIKPHYFDLWAISQWQLMQAGVLPTHIQIAGIDTYANEEDYFSHRRSKQTGRNATICALK